jgi:hypothetical protein
MSFPVVRDWSDARALFVRLALLAGAVTAANSYAAAPKGSTGECKDGSYTSAENKSGACSGHGGVKEWFAHKKPRGGDKVWVNADSKVYHCSGDKWYGKTKEGEYMSEAEARAKGNRADHGKACS